MKKPSPAGATWGPDWKGAPGPGRYAMDDVEVLELAGALRIRHPETDSWPARCAAQAALSQAAMMFKIFDIGVTEDETFANAERLLIECGYAYVNPLPRFGVNRLGQWRA